MRSNVWTTVISVAALVIIATGIPGSPVHLTSALAYEMGGRPDSLVVDASASSIRWKTVQSGSARAREGRVDFRSGLLVISHEKLTSGVFVARTRGSDVERSPLATFQSAGATRVGPARWRVRGDLTMNKVSRPIEFDTDVSWAGVGHMIATSTLTIDLRQWGTPFGDAGRDTDLPDGDVQLSLTLDARRKQAKVAAR
ncbi:MAG: YceI family protein [Gemmatimonadaceae bacterium]|nr:YceI family protein [Gemmatimonadaceae bacterium]